MSDEKPPSQKEIAYDLAEKVMEENTFATLPIGRHNSPVIHIYHEGVYVEGGEYLIAAYVQKIASPDDLSNNLVSEVLGNVARTTFTPLEKFTEPTPILVLENGLLNVETGQLEPHTPDFHSMSKLPVKYDPMADCPRFKKFLNEVLYPEDIPFIQEWLGYHFWRGYPTAVAVLLVGEGANGKSTLIGVIRAFLGPKNVAAVSLQAFERNTFAASNLFGKLANLYPDLTDEALTRVGLFKALTGGDTVTVERKYGQPFEMLNSAKLTFSANIVPLVFEDTQAFFRRIWIVTFPNTFVGLNADKDLLAKLTTPAELSGLLNWALEGLKRLRANGWNFTGTRSTAEVRADYIRRSDSVKAFVMGCTTADATAFVTKDDLYATYCLYCRKRGLPARNREAFFEWLPQVGKFIKAQRTVSGKRAYVIEGLALLAEEEWEKPAVESVGATITAKGMQAVQAMQDRLSTAQPTRPAQPSDILLPPQEKPTIREPKQEDGES